jgi:hypothetical protein
MVSHLVIPAMENPFFAAHFARISSSDSAFFSILELELDHQHLV